MQPKIYHLQDHQISFEKIDEHAFAVIQKLRQAGHKAYLVGGGVRDLLLNQPPKDFDVSTSAKPEEIRSLFRNAILIGRRFRLAHIRFGKKIIEVSTFRAGEAGAELIVRDNVWGTEEEDVLRRDFTINGLFYDPETEQVIDYVNGYPDLEKRVLRTIGDPQTRFTQDPVRMIRLLKFCARFDFEIEKPTFEALLSCKKEILKSSSARILEELLRMLESGSSKQFFYLLSQYGLLHPLLPELAHYMETHTENKTLEILGEIDAEIKKRSEVWDRSLLLAAMIFPLFEDYLKLKGKHFNKPLHLGQIAEASHHVLDCLFLPFFKLPRKTRAIVGFLMTTQYRFIPIDGRQPRRIRTPRDPFFPMALQLLKIRAKVQPELLPSYTFWTENTFTSHEAHQEEVKRGRRRTRASDER